MSSLPPRKKKLVTKKKSTLILSSENEILDEKDSHRRFRLKFPRKQNDIWLKFIIKSRAQNEIKIQLNRKLKKKIFSFLFFLFHHFDIRNGYKRKISKSKSSFFRSFFFIQGTKLNEEEKKFFFSDFQSPISIGKHRMRAPMIRRWSTSGDRYLNDRKTSNTYQSSNHHRRRDKI